MNSAVPKTSINARQKKVFQPADIKNSKENYQANDSTTQIPDILSLQALKLNRLINHFVDPVHLSFHTPKKDLITVATTILFEKLKELIWKVDCPSGTGVTANRILKQCCFNYNNIISYC